MLAVNLLRVTNDRINLYPAPVFQPIKKTAVATSMTGNTADLFHQQQDGIPVAVGPDLADFLNVTGDLALDPELLP